MCLPLWGAGQRGSLGWSAPWVAASRCLLRLCGRDRREGRARSWSEGQCWRKASKDLGVVWEAWLRERWRETGGGASEGLGLAPQGAGLLADARGGERLREREGYESSWGGWGMSLNVPLSPSAFTRLGFFDCIVLCRQHCARAAW